MQSFLNRFKILKNRGINIHYVLDIGAYRGEFTKTIHTLWPNAIVKQFEADERQKSFLQKNAFIVVLGNEEKEVDFFTLSEKFNTTGSSIYKELSTYYNENNTIILKKNMVTLDSLDEKFNFFGNWKEQGLIKIDSQGSELIILEGSKKFIEKRSPRFILLECPIQKYNLGAPNLNDYILTLSNLNYSVIDVFDFSYDFAGNLLQIDLMFERDIK